MSNKKISQNKIEKKRKGFINIKKIKLFYKTFKLKYFIILIFGIIISYLLFYPKNPALAKEPWFFTPEELQEYTKTIYPEAVKPEININGFSPMPYDGIVGGLICFALLSLYTYLNYFAKED